MVLNHICTARISQIEAFIGINYLYGPPRGVEFQGVQFVFHIVSSFLQSVSQPQSLLVLLH